MMNRQQAEVVLARMEAFMSMRDGNSGHFLRITRSEISAVLDHVATLRGDNAQAPLVSADDGIMTVSEVRRKLVREMMASGKSYDEIAKRLGISKNALKTLRWRMRQEESESSNIKDFSRQAIVVPQAMTLDYKRLMEKGWKRKDALGVLGLDEENGAA